MSAEKYLLFNIDTGEIINKATIVAQKRHYNQRTNVGNNIMNQSVVHTLIILRLNFPGE